MTSSLRRASTRIALATAAFAALGAWGASTALAAQEPAWTPYDRPAQNGIVEEKNVPITMSDGVQLNAIVRRPDTPGR